MDGNRVDYVFFQNDIKTMSLIFGPKINLKSQTKMAKKKQNRRKIIEI
jgi:hypothetical protein